MNTGKHAIQRGVRLCRLTVTSINYTHRGWVYWQRLGLCCTTMTRRSEVRQQGPKCVPSPLAKIIETLNANQAISKSFLLRTFERFVDHRKKLKHVQREVGHFCVFNLFCFVVSVFVFVSFSFFACFFLFRICVACVFFFCFQFDSKVIRVDLKLTRHLRPLNSHTICSWLLAAPSSSIVFFRLNATDHSV